MWFVLQDSQSYVERYSVSEYTKRQRYVMKTSGDCWVLCVWTLPWATLLIHACVGSFRGQGWITDSGDSAASPCVYNLAWWLHCRTCFQVGELGGEVTAPACVQFLHNHPELGSIFTGHGFCSSAIFYEYSSIVSFFSEISTISRKELFTIWPTY